VKGLLDRLMARQAKLMADLHPVPARQVQAGASRLTNAPVSAEERADRLKAEDQALTAAVEPLARGALDEAAALLEPHVDRAQDTRTLTTLSRIRSQQGDFDEALRLLQYADALDPSDAKVAYFMGELLQSAGRYQDEIYYRRRAAFSRADAGAVTFVKLIGAIVRAAGSGKPPPTGEIRAALKGLAGTADLTPQLRLEVAQQLYRVRGLAPQALTWLEDALPCPADQRQIEPRWHTMASWCASARMPMHVLNEAGTPGRRPWVAELRDALMHPGMRGTPVLDDGQALVYGFEDHNLRKRLEEASPLLLDKRTRAVLRVPRETLTIDEPALYVGGVGDDALDLLQHCGSLATVELLGMCADIPLVVNEPVAPRLRQLLGLLGFDRRRWITVASDQAMLFKHLWLPGRLMMRGRWVDPLLPQWYRRRLVDAAPAPRSGPARKLFVADASARGRVADEEGLMRVLTPLGFERIDPSGLGLRDVIDAFAAARELVLPYGGAMANLAFAAPGTRVVVLGDKRTVESAQALDYVLLGQAAQHDVRIVSGQPVRAGATDSPTGIDLRFASDDLLAALALTAPAA
jgi:tetratricopeptide (TPR) repeat protein